MTRITQIEDRGAAVAWSPNQSYADVLAVGTKDSGGIGFDNYGGELELYDLDITSPQDGGVPKPRVIGSVKTTSRFASIGWSAGAGGIAHPMGLLAGGMIDGTVHIWDPASTMTTGTKPLVATVNRHKGGAVSALEFNPHPASANLLATGGSDGEVLITSLEQPSQPNVYVPVPDQPKQGAEITQVAWNTQVAHIVASSAGNGTVVVWDLRQKKPWCELRCEANALSGLAWNPSQGLHIVTSGADSPIMKLWDLRTSTTMPLATLEGHGTGVLSLDWCPHDESLLLSCGKDNKTLLWDLFSLRPIAEIPIETDNNESANLYGGGLGSSQQKRYDVQWSPLRRGVISTCSFDRKVQAHSVIGAATKTGRPPKWFKTASGARCGFGGSIVSFSSTEKTVRIKNYVEQPKLKEASRHYEAAIAANDVSQFCDSMTKSPTDEQDARMWTFMQIIFQSNVREQLLGCLGFHSADFKRAAEEYKEDLTADVASISLQDKPTLPMSDKAVALVKDALLVGNFEAAVDCLIRCGNFADALVLASCGGAELWSKVQQKFFESETNKRPYLSIVGAVIHSQLDELVKASKLSQWQETLAILSTYGKPDEFPELCIALGDRLDEAGKAADASLCYMCALNLEKAAKYWRMQLDEANKTNGRMDLLALHSFVVKVTLFTQNQASSTLDPEIAELFSEYAQALSEQGLFVAAAKYSRGESEKAKILRDRLYRCKEHSNCAAALGSVPEFPFSLDKISVGPVTTTEQTAPEDTQAQPVAGGTSSQTQKPNVQSHMEQQQQTTPKLATGWMELQDPSSGRVYYANQATGETTWEMPQESVPAAQSRTNNAPQGASGTQSNQHPTGQGTQNQLETQQSMSSSASAPSRLASRYGDGFVTSASHPELAQQYGNVGTSNPYTGAVRPGTASVSNSSKAPVSGTFDPDRIPEIRAEHKPISDGLLAIVSFLEGVMLVGSDKKQFAEVQKNVAVLLKRLARGDINPQVAAKVASMVAAVQNRDYATATTIQTGLVNNDWKENKDWLKGMKFMIQLVSKKL